MTQLPTRARGILKSEIADRTSCRGLPKTTKCNICISPINHCKLNELFAHERHESADGHFWELNCIEFLRLPTSLACPHSSCPAWCTRPLGLRERVFNLNLISFPSSHCNPIIYRFAMGQTNKKRSNFFPACPRRPRDVEI